MKYIKYLNYVFRHRWFVFVECCKLGIPLLGILHDLSKFRPDEFLPYANHFCGRNKTGNYKAVNPTDNEFDFAWLLHLKRNKHHWQWWVLTDEDDGLAILEMPMRYRKEMLADWIGSDKAQQKHDTRAWYEAHKSKLQLGAQTRNFIEINLHVE